MGIQCFWFHIIAVYPPGLFEDVALESEGRLWSFLGGEFISNRIAWTPVISGCRYRSWLIHYLLKLMFW
jgi:hypothetical protein